MSNEQIVRALTEAGWHVHDLVDVVLDHAPEPTAPEIISIRNVSKHYDEVTALDGVSFGVATGGVTALLGPNGAGKTTLVRIMTTLLQPTSGEVAVAGLDVVRDAQKLRSQIGLAGQFAAIDEILTGRENLEMVGRLYHMTTPQAKARATELLHQFELDDAADRVAKT